MTTTTCVIYTFDSKNLQELETKLSEVAKDHEVNVVYYPIYNENNNSNRPDAMALSYTIDGKSADEKGEQYAYIFDNVNEEK